MARAFSGEPHPGAGVLRDLVSSAEQAIVASGRPAAEAGLVALQLWTSLHGIADLRLPKPEIDWPPAERMVEALLRQLGFSVV